MGKNYLLVAVAAALVGGIAGAIATTMIMGGNAHFGILRADRVLVSGALTVGDEEKGVKIADNKIVAETVQGRDIVATRQIRGLKIMGTGFLAATNYLEPDFAKCRIFGEFSATDIGGSLRLLNKDAAFVQAEGGVKTGNEIFFGHNNQGGPMLYSHEIAAGAEKLLQVPFIIKKPAAGEVPAQPAPTADAAKATPAPAAAPAAAPAPAAKPGPDTKARR